MTGDVITGRPDLTRRRFVAGGTALASAAALAGCSGSSRTTGPTSAAAGSDTTTSRPGAVLATLSDIPVGQAVSATLPDAEPVIVSRPAASTAACFSAICTHMGCTVAPAGRQLRCPCHGSVYNAATGTVVSGPAPRPLPAVPVTIEGGRVVTS